MKRRPWRRSPGDGQRTSLGSSKWRVSAPAETPAPLNFVPLASLMFVVWNFEAGQPKSLAEGKCVMAHFVKVGSTAELEDLEGEKFIRKPMGSASLSSISAEATMRSRARALIVAALSQRE